MFPNVIVFESWIILHWMSIPHFIYASNDGRLGCFHFLDVVSRAAMNIIVQGSHWVPTSILMGIYLGLIVFNFLRSWRKENFWTIMFFSSLTTTWICRPQMWCDRMSEMTLLPLGYTPQPVKCSRSWFGSPNTGHDGGRQFTLGVLSEPTMFPYEELYVFSQEDPDFPDNSKTNPASLDQSRLGPL